MYILYSKKEREKFPLSKIFTFVNPKRFCWWPCCSWQEFVCFVLFWTCAVWKPQPCLLRARRRVGLGSTQFACLGIHVLNTEQASTSPRCDSDRCYIHPLSLQCQPEWSSFLQSSLDLKHIYKLISWLDLRDSLFYFPLPPQLKKKQTQSPKPWMSRSDYSYQCIFKEFSSHLP